MKIYLGFILENLSITFTFIFMFFFLILVLLDFKKAVLFTFLFSFPIPFLSRVMLYADYLNGANFGKWFFDNPLITAINICLPFLLLLFFLRKFVKRKKILEYSLDKFVLIYIGFLFLNIFNPNQQSRVVGIFGFRQLVFPFTMYFLAREIITRRKNLDTIFRVIIIYGIVSIIYGFFQFFYWKQLPFEAFYINRTGGVFFQDVVNKVGLRIFSLSSGDMEYFFPLTAFAVILLIVGRHHFDKKWNMLRFSFVLGFITLQITSLVRTPILMLVIGFLSSIIFIRNLSQFKRRTLIVVQRTLLVVLVFIMLYYAFYSITPLLKATGDMGATRLAELSNPTKAQTFQWRAKNQWTYALKLSKKNLMGMGVGSGRLTRVVLKNPDLSYFGPHNEYLLTLFETGFIGLLLYILLQIRLVKFLINISRQYDDFLNRFASGLIGTFISFVLCSIVNIPFEGQGGLAFWFLVGSLFRLHFIRFTLKPRCCK